MKVGFMHNGTYEDCREKKSEFWRCSAVVILLVVLLCSLGRAAYGQAQNTGTVSGNVADSTNAAIPNASVTLTSIGTGQVTRVLSNGKGEYVLNDVHVGQYRLQVSAPGFGNFTVDSVAVNAEQNVTIDAKLNLGTVQASVEVQETGVTIDTRSATVGTLIDQTLIENLPIDSNNIVSLAGLLPGVVNVSAPTTFTNDTSGPTYNSSGSRSNQNLMLLDGMMWNNVFYNTGLNYPPSQALQEVSVLLADYKAQYGRNSGSVFNVITRSGTNKFHGALWEFFQNRALDASDYLTHVNPKLVMNQFGATAGGPILHNRLFFFTSFQDTRIAQQVTANDFLLTANERGLNADGTPHACNAAGAFPGDTCASFAEDAETTGATLNRFLINPVVSSNAVTATSAFNAAYAQAGGSGTSPCVTRLRSAGTYVPYAEIPSECFNPVTQAFLNKYVPASVPYSGSGNLPYTTTTAPQPRNDMNFLIRGDLNLQRHSIDARYYFQGANDVTSNSVSGGQGIASYDLDLNTAALNFGSIGDTWVVRPNLLNVARIGYKRYDYTVNPTDPTTLSNLGANLQLPARPQLPGIVVYNRFTAGGTSSAYTHTINQTLEFDDNLSWTRGRHNFQVGATWLHLQYDTHADNPGTYQFGNNNTGNAAADFITGLTYQQTEGNSRFLNASAPNLYMYAQDDWRVLPKLTLNLGVRYEIPFVWRASHGRSTTFIPGYQSQVFPQAPANLAYIGDRGVNPTLIPTPYTNIAPRFGFAYDTFGKGSTIVRGGFGIFYDAVNASTVGTGEPYVFQATYTLPAGGFSNPLLGQNPIPANYSPGQAPQFVGPYSITYTDPHFSTSYTEAANIGVLQKIKKRGFFEADYIVKLGRHQLIGVDRNPSIYDCSGAYYQVNPSLYCNSNPGTAASYAARVLYPGFNYGGQAIVDLMPEATSNYHALQLIGGVHGSRWLTFQASYTYSKSMSERDNGLATNATLADVFPKINIRYNYGASSFDARHIMNLGYVLDLDVLQKVFNPNIPLGKVGKAILKNWKFTGVYGAHTGMPFNISSPDRTFTSENGQRAVLIPGANPYLPSGRPRLQQVSEYFNINAFAEAPLGTLSTLPQNFLYGPAYISNNMALGRTFKLPRAMSLRFRADAFNVFNTPNLSNPNSSFSQSAGNEFGQVLSTAGSNGAVNTNGRRMQLSLSLNY